MALFNKRENPDPRAAIEQFWTWWPQRRDEILAAAKAEDTDRLRELIGPAVTALDANLEWQFRVGKGGAPHTFVVTGGPRLGLRGLTERWALAAPGDAEVEFEPARSPHPALFETTGVVDGYEVPYGEAVVGARIDQENGRLNVTVHHPLFPLLGDGARAEVASNLLVAALGDDGAERWLGEVTMAADAPMDAFAASALPPLTDQLAGSGPRWIEMRGKSRLGKVQASVKRPLSRVDRPLCDHHLTVVVPYPAGRDGLPTGDHVATAVRDFRDEVLRAAGGDGPHAIAVGHELMAKRAYIHTYVDGATFDRGPVDELIATWPFGKGKVAVRDDPAWRRVARLLG